MNLHIFIKHPYLLPLNKQFTHYEGFLTVKEIDIHVELNVPNYPSTKELKIIFKNNFHIESQHEIDSLISENLSFDLFLDRLVDIIKQSALSNTLNLNSIQSVNSFIEEYEILKQHPNVTRIKLNRNLNVLKLNYQDAGSRIHELVVVFNKDNLYRVKNISFPNCQRKDFLLKKAHSSLMKLVEYFTLSIDGLQNFFDTMDSLDGICWVIDPVKPTREDFERRIIIGTNVSMQVKFDPWNIDLRPQIQFLGSEKNVAPFKKNMVSNLEYWDSEYDVVENLVRLLDIPFFPMKPLCGNDSAAGNSMDYEAGECCICFCPRLDGKLCDKVCEQCEQNFHTICLYEWLSSIGTNHISFKTISGECPNCKTNISCLIPM